MNASIARRWESSRDLLVKLSAPTLKAEYQPLRPPMIAKPATATIAEIIASKARVN